MTEDDYSAARRAMVLNQLRPQGVSNAAVIAAMGSVARERFVPEGMRASAYADRSLLLESGSPMMPPTELGILLNALDPRPGERALVVGNGGAYSAAVLEALGLTVTRSDADAPAGRDQYDFVLIEGAVEQFPGWVAGRVAPGGRVAAALMDGGVARLSIGRCTGGAIGFASIADAQVPPNRAFAARPVFTF